MGGGVARVPRRVRVPASGAEPVLSGGTLVGVPGPAGRIRGDVGNGPVPPLLGEKMGT